MSIRLKLLIMFLALALIPLLLVSALTFNNYKHSLEANRLAQLRDLVSFKADKIETYFAGLKADVELLQNSSVIKKNLATLARLANSPADPEFVSAKKEVDDVMRNTAITFSIFDIMLVDAGGRVVYALSSKHSPVELSNPLPDHGQKAFKKGKAGLCISNIYLNEIDDNKPAMLVTAPACDMNDVPAGVIAMEVDMAPVYKLIQDVTGLGNTGETLIGRKDGNQVLYLNPLRHDPEAALKRRVTMGGITGSAIQKAAEGHDGAGLTIDYRGKKVVAAWRYIPSLDWGLVAKIDAQEAFADVLNLRNLIFMILGIIVVLSGIMAFSIAQSISGPIKRVAEGAEIIGSGNLDYKIASDSRDEIGQLARTFDKMARDLKNLGIAREAERQRLYGVLETLPVYVVLLTEDYHVPFANRFFRERFGESCGKRCYEYLFNGAEPCENCETYKVLKTGKPHHWEWTGPDGRNYDIYDFPFRDTDGSSMILEMGIDITDQKRAQESLRSASRYARNLIEVSLDPLVTISSDGKITDVNEATIKVTGVPREQLIGADFSDYFTEPEKAREGYRQVFARGFVTDYPLTIRRKDGHLTDVLYNASVYKDPRGNVLGVFAAARDVTIQKQAEAELRRHRDNLEALVNERTKDLRESEQRLNRSQEIAHLGSWELDLVNNRLTWSDEVYRIFGLKPQEFSATYEAFLEAVYPDDRAAVDAVYSGSLREKNDRYEIEHRVVRKSDGAVRIVHEKCEHIRDETGRIIRSVGMVHDITERKRAEEALAVERNNLQKIFDAVSIGMLLIDEHGVVKRINNVASRWIGKDRPALGNAQPGDILGCIHALNNPAGCGQTPHCDTCPIRKAFESVLRSGKPVHGAEAEANLLIDGSQVRLWLDLSIDPIFIDGKTLAIFSIDDITERKRAEARENEALAIAMSARTAMDTLQAMGEGVLLMDMNGHILSVNPALEQLSGLQKNEVLGRPLMDFLLPMLEEKDKPMALEAYATALSGKNPQLQPLTLINKRGCFIPVIPSVSFIRAPDGKATAIILTVRDISEIRAMQQNLEENNTRLRALAARLSSTEERERHRISAQIHDTVIQTLSLSNIKLGALFKELAGTGSKNSIKEVTAIRAIIEDAIRESRSLMAELTPPLLYELGLVPAITDLAQKLQKQHDTPIHVKDDEQPGQIDKAIQGILFQATRELILNALKHAGKCAITITVSRENDRLRICVKDNGSGFSVPEEGRFVFHSSGGFGLFAIRERLERIGGSIVIRSQAGAGTSVSLFAPLALRNAEGRMKN